MSLFLERHRSLLRITAPLFLVLASAGRARAQTRSTAVQQVRLQAFVLPTYVRPDFGGSTRNLGATVGADANFGSPLRHTQISAEFRALGSGGDVSNQYVYSIGPRVIVGFGRLQPYGDLLIGYGSIHFNRPVGNYTQDNSAVYSFGGGLDLALDDTWAVRADVQKQHWRIADAAPPFYPSQFSLGLRYQFHFRSRGSPF